jgi:hypothetical protein
MKIILSILIFSFFSVGFAQTSNNNLNSQLQLMKKYFLERNFAEYSNFVYPKVIEIYGGKEKMILLSQTSIKKMEAQGYSILDISFKDPSKFITEGNETQFSITQELTIQSPKGKMVSEFTLIGISIDNGENWKFIDTAGRTKDKIIQKFPNLNAEIIINPIQQKFID